MIKISRVKARHALLIHIVTRRLSRDKTNYRALSDRAQILISADPLSSGKGKPSSSPADEARFNKPIAHGTTSAIAAREGENDVRETFQKEGPGECDVLL